jgi:hypothetical protein
MATVRIGGTEAAADVEEIDGVFTCELKAGEPEDLDGFIRLAVPGAKAVISYDDGDEYEGRVTITDPWDYVTVVEI